MIDVTALVRLALLLVRPGTLVLASPAFGGIYAPAPVKIGLTVLVALALLPVVQVPVDSSAIGLAALVFHEFGIGLALAMAIRALTAAAELGGHLIGFQMGLSYSAIVDPQSGVRNNIMATLYANIALIMFFLVNAHHAFLRALRDSYETLPLGSGTIGAALPQAVVGLLGLIFTFGVRLAAPIVVVLVVSEVVMALVSRSAPALNLMVIGAPIRLLIGLILLGLVMPSAINMLGGLAGTALQAGVRTAGAFR